MNGPAHAIHEAKRAAADGKIYFVILVIILVALTIVKMNSQLVTLLCGS